MTVKVLHVKDWNENFELKKEFTIDKKYCANSWDTTISEIYIPKSYVINPKARQVSFKEWITLSHEYKTESADGLKLHPTVINIIDRSVCMFFIQN